MFCGWRRMLRWQINRNCEFFSNVEMKVTDVNALLALLMSYCKIKKALRFSVRCFAPHFCQNVRRACPLRKQTSIGFNDGNIVCTGLYICLPCTLLKISEQNVLPKRRQSALSQLSSLLIDWLRALSASGIPHIIFDNRAPRRGFSTPPHCLRLCRGYVVQFYVALRGQCPNVRCLISTP